MLSEILQEEMKARGWDDDYIDYILPDPAENIAVSLAIYLEDKPFILDQGTANLLSKIFDIRSDFFINMNKADLEKAKIKKELKC